MAVKGWQVKAGDSVTSIVFAETRSKAKYVTFRSASEVGYDVKFSDLTARRAKQFDCIANGRGKYECLTVEHAERLAQLQRDAKARESIEAIRGVFAPVSAVNNNL